MGASQNKDCKDCLVQTESSVYSNSLFMPSVRLAALNMVNDALQKIGHLEFKLSELYRAQGNHPPLSAPPNSIMTSHPPFPLARRNSNKLARKDRAQMCASNSPLHKWTNGAPNETALLADSQDGSIRTTN
ncbi:unnamed protein product [Dicrocoelium dendriticum]|nr:unnamed protein product [Dicrocoelium dendriticum]